MSTRPFVPIALGWALGIALAYFVPGLSSHLLGGIGLASGLALFLPSKGLGFLPLVVFSGVVGYSRSSQVTDPGPFDVSRYVARSPVVLKGMIISDPESRPGSLGFQLAVLEVTRWGIKHSATGKVQVWLRSPSTGYRFYHQEKTLQYGDLLLLRGKLSRPRPARPQDSFDYRQYLSRRGIFAVLALYAPRDIHILSRGGGNPFIRFCLKVKSHLVKSLRRNLGSEDYGILAGLLFSSKAQMNHSILSDFQRSGAFHLLSSSGIHVTILAWLLGVLIQARGPNLRGRIKALLLIIATVGYSIMAGGRPAVVRSALMTSLYWGAPLVRREADSLNTLCFAGWMLLAGQPLYLLDLGFQLSFLSVAGLILFTPLLDRMILERGKEDRPLWLKRGIQSFSSSLSATLAVSPLLAYSTKTLSLISPIANLFAIPLAGGVMAGGLLHTILGLLYIPFQSYTAMIVQLITVIFIKTVHFWGNLPLAYLEITSFSPFWLIVIYSPLFTIACFFYSKLSEDSPLPSEKKKGGK